MALEGALMALEIPLWEKNERRRRWNTGRRHKTLDDEEKTGGDGEKTLGGEAGTRGGQQEIRQFVEVQPGLKLIGGDVHQRRFNRIGGSASAVFAADYPPDLGGFLCVARLV